MAYLGANRIKVRTRQPCKSRQWDYGSGSVQHGTLFEKSENPCGDKFKIMDRDMSLISDTYMESNRIVAL